MQEESKEGLILAKSIPISNCRDTVMNKNSVRTFSGVMRRMLTADPRYIPRYPSARYVFLKQSSIDEYIFSPLGPGCE